MCPPGRDRQAKPAGNTDFRGAFDVIDVDRDGKISAEDLRTFYTDVSCAEEITSDEDIGSMISVADLNKDGFVEFDEFERVLLLNGSATKTKTKTTSGGMMEDVFKVMDRDGDGKVGLDDLRSYMRWAGLSATDDEIVAMLRLGGGDENDGVCYQGLMKILAVDSTV